VEITAPAAPAANPTTVSPPAVNPPAVAVSKPMPNPPAAKKVNVAEHPLAQHALMALRNKHTAPAQFRRISNQLLVLLAIEATRSLPTRDDLVETATGAEVTSPPWPRSPNARDDAAKSHSTTHTGQVLAKPVVLLSLTRHGLGLAHNLTDLIPDLLVGTISLDRTGDNPGAEPRLHLINAPALGDARVILFDPVVATGASASQALNFLRRSGATDITLISFLVSFQGLSRVQTTLPDLAVWTAGIDNEWDSKRGSLAGLGNFGARLYG
jgi:uracil phosphoribosyltransferase